MNCCVLFIFDGSCRGCGRITGIAVGIWMLVLLAIRVWAVAYWYGSEYKSLERALTAAFSAGLVPVEAYLREFYLILT